MLATYLERHSRGELSDMDVTRLIAELRRLRDELKVARHELLQVRRRASVLRGRLDRATS